MDFQHRTAAWLAVRILAEEDAARPFDLPDTALLEALHCETNQPVDDVLVGTRVGGFAFIQVKHFLTLEEAADSDLASILRQFVLQFLAGAPATTTSRERRIRLDPSRDRLVLVVGSATSAAVRKHLPAALTRLSSRRLQDTAANQEEKQALRVALKHLRTAWKSVTGSLPTEAEIRALLALVRIQVLSVEVGGTDEDSVKMLLRQILRDPWQADAAWAALINACSGFASTHSGADRLHLQQILLNQSLALKAPRSYREDIDHLRQYSKRLASLYADLARIRVGPVEIKIRRHATGELRRLAEENSLLVTGDPGIGKSGAVRDLLEQLETEGRDNILFAVDRVEAGSLGALRKDLGLAHDLADILANWPGTQPAFLVIDALDAARGAPAEQTFRDLIQLIAGTKGRWRVIASIRKFDLRYSPELRQLFMGKVTVLPPPELQDSEFVRIRHLNLPVLTDDELAQVAPLSAELHTVITNAPPVLHELLRVPFNLRLMAELLSDGVSPSDLTPIRSQVELLDRYWLHRIAYSGGDSYGREQVLRLTCNEMVTRRMLRAQASRITVPGLTGALGELLHDNVLTEWRPSPDSSPDRSVLTFAHHVLFDYAVDRLLLREDPPAVVRRLAEERDLPLLIRPSLVFHFQYLWMLDPAHRQFWDVLFRIMCESRIAEITKLIGPSVAAEAARDLSDFEGLILALESPESGIRTAAELALAHMIRSVLAAPAVKSSLIGAGTGPWSDFVERVSRNLTAPVAFPIRPLVSLLSQTPDRLTPPQLSAVGKAARQLLTFAWAQTERYAGMIRFSLESVCLTFESDSAASAALLRRALAHEHMAKYAFEEMYWLANQIKRLIPIAPGFVTDVYGAVFEHQESSDAMTPLGGSQILPMSSTRKQDFHMAQYELAEVYPEFLVRAPVHAARALITILEAYVVERHSPPSGTWIDETFEFGTQTVMIRFDFSKIWDAGDSFDRWQ